MKKALPIYFGPVISMEICPPEIPCPPYRKYWKEDDSKEGAIRRSLDTIHRMEGQNIQGTESPAESVLIENE